MTQSKWIFGYVAIALGLCLTACGMEPCHSSGGQGCCLTCPDDYCRKPLPKCPSPVCSCQPDDYCRKPLPKCPPPVCSCQPDDYCRKPLPKCPDCCAPPWYVCGPTHAPSAPASPSTLPVPKSPPSATTPAPLKSAIQPVSITSPQTRQNSKPGSRLVYD